MSYCRIDNVIAIGICISFRLKANFTVHYSLFESGEWRAKMRVENAGSQDKQLVSKTKNIYRFRMPRRGCSW